MSLNLCFKHTLPSGKVVYSEFPFQTPTSLTETVLSTEDKKEQCKLLCDWCLEAGWYIEDIREVIFEVESELKDPNTTLGMT